MQNAPGTDKSPESAPAGATRSLDRDLYCLKCGYNLRGLAGDPIRCPECGFQNPLGDVEVPADRIREQLRRMESAPTYNLACSLGVVGLLLLLIALGPVEFVRSVCLPACLVIFLAGWWFTMWRYEHSCLSKPGWMSALIHFQLCGALLIGGVVGLPVLFIWLLALPWMRGNLPSTAQVLLMASAFVAPLAFSWWIARIYRYAKQPMEALQRQVAVDLARDLLRKRLARQR